MDHVANRAVQSLLQEREVVEKDDDVRREDESDEVDDKEVTYDKYDLPPMGAPYVRGQGNTGPKGVMADFAEFKELKKAEAELKTMKWEWEMKKLALGNRYREEDERRAQAQVDNNEEEILEEDEEDEIFKQYREQRLKEIRATLNPTFGYLKKVDGGEFIVALESERSHVYVIVHAYQDYIPACRTMNMALQQLAIKYPHTKFLKILSSEAPGSFDDVTLPILLVYQGGQLRASYVRIQDIIGNSFDVDHVEKFLLKNNVITKPIS